MTVVEVILIALTLAIALAALADRMGVAYPILLVLGGIVLGLVPGVPHVTINPGLLFLLFIPPLVFSAGWRTSLTDVRTYLWPIIVLSIGLVLATLVVVAIVAHFWVDGMPWPAAFVLGAILSSTDVVAATTIAGRLHLGRGIVTVLEGESVGNDAASLVAYRAAVAATVTGAFSLVAATLHVVLAVVVGIAIGVAVALVYEWFQQWVRNPPLEVALTLVVPFFAYIPADQVGASGVLAVLTTGLVAGWRVNPGREPESRLEATAFWNSLIFVLNGLIFVLLGLYLPGILSGISGLPVTLLARYTAIILLTILVVRALWMFAMPYFGMSRAGRRGDAGRDPAWKSSAVLTWAGMRGASTLIIALALPFAIATGAPFPDRSLIIFLTFTVIVVTLVVQGSSLPWLIHRLGLQGDDGGDREEAVARTVAAQAALRRLDDVLGSGQTPADGTNVENGTRIVTRELTEQLRGTYERRLRHQDARARGVSDEAIEAKAEAASGLRRDLVQVQRQAVIGLRNSGEIGDAAMRTVLRDLDLEEQQLG
ncbi:MAG: Na+/H+ antiporter [Ktedonobacterales bacterium]